MHIISPKARLVCGVIASITSAILLASTVLGLTSSEFALVTIAQVPDGHPASANPTS